MEVEREVEREPNRERGEFRAEADAGELAGGEVARREACPGRNERSVGFEKAVAVEYGEHVHAGGDPVARAAQSLGESAVGRGALDEDIAPDDQGNRARGIRLAALDCHNNHIRWKVDQGGDPETLLAMIDVDGLQVIRQGNVLLITRRGNDRRITTLLDQLTEMGLEDYR